ncbi:MAG: amidohydrolase family protein [Dehalococcoidia bacterium]|nr:amidohydrolase family protein [Dehalococcoidia bacterium]
MLIVDTHCHAGTNWFEPVEMLVHQMDMNGVAKAVLIQHGGNHDNHYLLECLRRFPGRFVAVVGVDVARPDAPHILERLAKERGVVGIRLHPRDRSPGDDPLAIWRKAGELGLTISCFLVDADLTAAPEFQALVKALPGCTFVLEHLAGVYRTRSPGSATPPYTAFRTALNLAKYPNTYIKFGGLGEFCERPAQLPLPLSFGEVLPLLDMAKEAFGPHRMMWGSDYSPVSGREGYRNALQGPMSQGTFRTDDDREWAFGKTALEVWKMDES